MKNNRLKIAIYIIIYIVIIVIVVLGLSYNIKTISLSKLNHDLDARIRKFQEVNQQMDLQIMNATNYFRLEKKAMNMSYIKPKRIHYIFVPTNVKN